MVELATDNETEAEEPKDAVNTPGPNAVMKPLLLSTVATLGFDEVKLTIDVTSASATVGNPVPLKSALARRRAT
jgi:hypothetical protein